MNMETTTILVGFASAAITLFVTVFLRRYFLKQSLVEITQRDERIKALEKQKHLYEREVLEQQNKNELAYFEKYKEIKQTSYTEGQAQGFVEGKREALSEIVTLQNDFSKRIVGERAAAADEARRTLRAEYELQTKLFSVLIHPYVRIIEDKGFFSSENKIEIGYQFQLMVNGLPAFTPYVIIERQEHRKEIDQGKIDDLIKIATTLATAAVNMYLGANGQFAKVANPITKRGNEKGA